MTVFEHSYKLYFSQKIRVKATCRHFFSYCKLAFLAFLFAKSSITASKFRWQANVELKYSMPNDDRRNCPIIDPRSFLRMVNPLNERSAPATDTGNVQKMCSATHTFGKSPSKFSAARRFSRS